MNDCLRPGGLDFTGELLRASGLAPGAAVLDVGCGAGATVAYLLEQGYAAAGLDVDAQAIERAAQGSVTLRAALHVGDVRALPFAAESLDGVLAECMLSACGDAPAALREIARVLRPGGWLLVSDVYFPSGLATLSKLRVSAEGWQSAVRAAGLIAAWQRDRSEAWKEFFLWALWNDAYSFPCDCKGCGQAGYMLLCAQKPARSHVPTSHGTFHLRAT